jgi:transcriptional regulator with XRE-family HTH domain
MPRTRQKRPRRAQNLTADQVIADQVRSLRRGMSQQALADKLGWKQSTIARIESGDRAISVGDLLALSWALNVAPAYLLAGSFQSGDVPIHETLRVPPKHMLSWIRGGEPLPGLDYRAYFENIPDDEWLEAYGPVAEQRNRAARSYASTEKLLATGAVERTPGREQTLSPERRAELAEERAERTRQLAASQRAKESARKRTAKGKS